MNDRFFGMPPAVAAAVITAVTVLVTTAFNKWDELFPEKPPAASSEWTHFEVTDGHQAGKQLTLIGPKQSDVAATVYGNSIHVWYRGGASGTRYDYSHLPWDPQRPTQYQVFHNEGRVVPIGFSRIGEQGAVSLLYFQVSN